MPLSPCRRLVFAGIAVCGLVGRWGTICPCACGAEGAVVAVQLHSGRVLTGVVDARTDAAELSLHSAEPSVLVLTSTPWPEIHSARMAGRQLTAQDFRIEAEQSKTPLPLGRFQQPVQPAQSPPPPGRVRSLDVFATVANWDRDPQSDGLELHLNPLTADGDTAAVEGMLTVRLLGRRLGTQDLRTTPPSFGFWTNGIQPAEYAPLHANVHYQELGRWSERVRASRFSFQGYILRLPFRTVHPERDLDIAPEGLVECRLSVRGQRIFYATSPVQLRVYSPLRDALQLDRGVRFFPDETPAY